MADGDVVKNIEVKLRFAIRENAWDDEVRYDWYDDRGDESDEVFETVEEAELDIRGRFR